jgi:hypothetical protein
MRVDYQNIQLYTGKGTQKALAFAVLVKSRFANGKIYNWRKFDTKEFGISRTTYFRYVRELQKWGHISFEGPHLQIKCLYEIYTKEQRQQQKKQYGTILYNPIKRFSIGYFHKKNILETSLDLISNLFIEEYRKQANLINLKLSANSIRKGEPADVVEQAKKDRRKLRKLGYEVSGKTKEFALDKKIRFSIDTLQKELQLSKHALYQLLSFMKKNCGLHVMKDIEFVGRYVKGMEEAYKGQKTFISKGYNFYVCNANIYHVAGVV